MEKDVGPVETGRPQRHIRAVFSDDTFTVFHPTRFVSVALLSNGVQAMLPDGALLALLVGSLGLDSEFGWGRGRRLLCSGRYGSSCCSDESMRTHS
jgi:hypothetical protein